MFGPVAGICKGKKTIESNGVVSCNILNCTYRVIILSTYPNSEANLKKLIDFCLGQEQNCINAIGGELCTVPILNQRPDQWLFGPSSYHHHLSCLALIEGNCSCSQLSSSLLQRDFFPGWHLITKRDYYLRKTHCTRYSSESKPKPKPLPTNHHFAQVFLPEALLRGSPIHVHLSHQPVGQDS